MTQDLIAAFMSQLSAAATAYYEEAPATATFPFCIASGFDVQDLGFGYQITVDVDHWHEEGTGNASTLEAQCDTVREALHDKTISKTGSFRAAIYFDAQSVTVDGEQDLIRRRQTFIVRAFFM